MATKVFQALRIFVNDELNQLHNGLEDVYSLLKPGMALLVYLFISLFCMFMQVVDNFYHCMQV